MISADFHSHTHYSPDARTSPQELVERAMHAGIDRIVVTDHNAIDGALAVHELAPDRVIVGQEVRARCGTELIGIYMHEYVPDGLPAEEVAERLRDQGALVYAPHPFAYPRRVPLRSATALRLADVIEVFNSRAFRPAWNRRAAGAAARRGLLMAGGSDAHFPHEIGRARTILPAFHDAPSLRKALAEARVVRRKTGSALLHVASFALAVGRWSGLRPAPTAWPGPRRRVTGMPPRPQAA